MSGTKWRRHEGLSALRSSFRGHTGVGVICDPARTLPRVNLDKTGCYPVLQNTAVAAGARFRATAQNRGGR